MIRNRGAAIIVQEGKIALIKRIREEETYYVFPGGGVEEGETPEEATKREVYEELGLHIKVEHLIAKVNIKEMNIIMVPILQAECSEVEQLRNFSGKVEEYIPMLPINELEKVNIKPYEVVGNIFNHYKI
ncbi:NUDIX domain-containing protein [Bacillus sp. CB62A.1]